MEPHLLVGPRPEVLDSLLQKGRMAPRINATVTLTGFGRGTRIDMVCAYGDYASRGRATTENLAMVLVGHNGIQNEVATWVGVNGATALPSGNTTMQ
jgi:hypothetical protein